MLDWQFLLGAGLFVVGIVVSRMLSERNFAKLDDSQKVRVMDSFSSMRMWNLVPVFMVMVLFLGVVWIQPRYTTLASWVVMSLLVVFLFVRHFMVRRKLSSIQAPDWYARGVLLSSAVYYAGIIVFLATTLIPRGKG